MTLSLTGRHDNSRDGESSDSNSSSQDSDSDGDLDTLAVLLAGKSAKEVIVGLGDGTIQPGYENPSEKWFVSECLCKAEDPKLCTCECGYRDFKKALSSKLDASAHIDKGEIAAAKEDWKFHFDKWDDHECFLTSTRPTWAWPECPAKSIEVDGASRKAGALCVLCYVRSFLCGMCVCRCLIACVCTCVICMCYTCNRSRW
jgi:hypothetical protein